MAWQTQKVPFGNDGESLATAVSVTSDGVVGGAVTVGRGQYFVDFTVASYVGGTSFDNMLIIIQANSINADSTWYEVGNILLGDATGRGTALTSVTNAVVGILNQSDSEVRLYAYINGSAVSATVTAKIYPASAVMGA